MTGEATGPARTPEVPGYSVGKRLGAGGFGEVFAAHHTLMGRHVAIKVLHERYGSDPEAVGRFIAEARAIARISHPRIVEVFDFGELADGRHYCVMELVKGRTLREVLRERPHVPLTEALPLLRGIAEAIDAAHAAGIAHRDLKPDNVFVLDTGVKLIDFGLAKLTSDASAPITETGATLGTPRYMSPEQCRGRKVDTRTDLYSFGVLAFEMLVGAPPFSGEPIELALQHLNEKPPTPTKLDPSLPPHVDRVIGALLAKDPAERPTPLRDVVDALAGNIVIRRRRRGRNFAWLALPALALVAGTLWKLVPAGSPAAYALRALPLRVDGPLMSIDITPTGDAIYYGDVIGPHRLDLSTLAVTPAIEDNMQVTPTVAGLSLRISDRDVVIDDGNTRRRIDLSRAIGRENVPTISPDGHHVAVVEKDGFTVVDIATGTKRRLVAGNGVSARWSSDSQTIWWTALDTRTITATRIADGAIHQFDLPFLTRGTQVTPIADIPDGRLVYCREDARGSSVRLRRVDDEAGADEQVVTSLPLWVSACEIAVTPTGRIVVGLQGGRPRAATIDLARPHAQLRIIDELDGDRFPLILAENGNAVYTSAFGDQLSEVRASSLDGMGRTPIATCSGDVALVQNRGALFHVQRSSKPEGVVFDLRDERCHVVGEWHLPAGKWMRFRCDAAHCYVLEQREHVVVVWMLDRDEHRGTTPLVSVDLDRPPTNNPGLSISPNGKRLALHLEDRSTTLVDLATHTASTLPLTLELDASIIQSAEWQDNDHLIMSGMNIGGDNYVLLRVTPDGRSREVVWSSAYDWFALRDARGTVLAGTAQHPHVEFLILDPP